MSRKQTKKCNRTVVLIKKHIFLIWFLERKYQTDTMQPLRMSKNAIGRGLELPTNIQHYPSDEKRKLQPNCKSETLKIIYVSLTKKNTVKSYLRFRKHFSETVFC